MSIPHYFTESPNGVNVVVAFDATRAEPVLTADSNHPCFEQIKEGLRNGDESVLELFDVGTSMANRFRQISDRVSWDGKNILWDGDPIHTTLANQVRRALETGETNYEALAKFWEKLESNPNQHSKEQAYDWLASHEFQITEEGDVVGYKGVHVGSLGDGQDVYLSTWASEVPNKPSGYVNGEAVPERSRVPQSVGDVVSMPRSEVVHDPAQACRRGLHVATRSYAQSYGSAVLEVHVNPRDIVSVPTDGGGKKVRACKYKVARVAVETEAYGKSPVLSANTNTWAGDVSYQV